MYIEQVRAAAEAQLSHLSNPSCTRILVGAGPDSVRIFEQLQNAEAQSKVIQTGSFGYYDLDPIVTVIKPGLAPLFYTNVTLENAKEILTGASGLSSLPSFNRQKRIALRNCGWIDPEDINSYIVQGHGYTALYKALDQNSEGFGDACLICNADPKSLNSKLLLESDPHSVLEGIAIRAVAMGVSHSYILVENKTESVKKLRKALDQMRGYNLIGSHVFDTPFCLEIDLIETPENWPLGNRMELLRCIEQQQPLPRLLPSSASIPVLFGKKVAIVNPESMAKISAGPDTKKTKVVTLIGRRTVEISASGSIGTLIDEFVINKDIKAVHAGGPAGMLVSSGNFDAKVDFDNVEVIDPGASVLDATKNIMAYIQSQSCGKCVFCREGCIQILTILEDITENRGKRQDLDLILEIGEQMRIASLCDFGRSAPNPILSGIQLFRSDFEKKL